MTKYNSLDETDCYALLYFYEDFLLFDKDLNKDVWHASMYGDPTCGLISQDNEWAAVGGHELYIWYNNILKLVEDEELHEIYDMRQTGKTKIELLTDPWAENPAIWRLDVRDLSKTKVRDFLEYQGKEYVEDVKW